ncbi:hypothetical protein ACQKQD_07990 [Methylobacterium sp. NPDC080182]|uniref:hypothetical protein n=1 Tax=Methylobacterium sp. NPDC080182 TaxID=3390590 RepID=UPI003CFD309B
MSIKDFAKSQNGSQPDKDAVKAQRDLLLKVYDAAIAEYRFNVQLNWDRVKFYIGLAVSGIAAGTAVFKIYNDSFFASFLLMIYFFILAAVTTFGSRAISKGKEYSRQAVLTKTLVERELGLFRQLEGLKDPDLHLGIAVTPGQRKYINVIFGRKEREAKKPDPGSILQATQWIFVALIAVQIMFGILAWFGAASVHDRPTKNASSQRQGS